MREAELATRTVANAALRRLTRSVVAVDSPAVRDALERVADGTLRVCVLSATDPASNKKTTSASSDPKASHPIFRLRLTATHDTLVAEWEPSDTGTDGDDSVGVDVEIKATAATLMAATNGENPAGLRIEGDASALRAWQRLLDALRAAHGLQAWRSRITGAIDALLAPIGGAGVASRVDAELARVEKRLQQAAVTAMEDAAVFAQREKNWLPEREALEDLSDASSALRDRIAWLERRTADVERRVAHRLVTAASPGNTESDLSNSPWNRSGAKR